MRLIYGVSLSVAAALQAVTGAGISSQAAAQTVTTYSSNINAPEGLALDGSGNLFVATFGGSILQVAPGGGQANAFATLPSQGVYGLARNSTGTLYAAARGDEVIYTIGATGAVSTFNDNLDFSPNALAINGNGVLYASGGDNTTGRAQIYSFDSTGSESLVVDATPAMNFGNAIDGLTFDSNNNLFFSDHGDQNIYERTAAGVLSIYGVAPGTAQGNRGLAFGSDGSLYAANFYDGDILKIAPGGGVGTLFTDAVDPPQFLTSRGNTLYSSSAYSSTIDKIDLAPAGAVPEPSSWALMVSGFGAVGGFMRSGRRGRVSALAAV